ncbi:MAG: branched-chain amino acid ABC transporter permease [Dehalococcoidia bacterium]|jgi:branched-chain amino acid transport system permease protein
MTDTIKYRKERIDRGIYARTTDMFALSSWRELSYLLLPRIVPVVLLLLLPVVMMVFVNEYWANVSVLLAIMGILALTWDLLRTAGMFSLGHGLFIGLGAYICGTFSHFLGWPIYLTIPIGALGGGLLSTVILMGTLKLRGIYFAMITFAFPMLLVRVITATNYLEGTAGVSIAGFPNFWVSAYVSIGLLLICLFGFRRLMDSDWGLVARAIGQDDIAVLASGINVNWRKIQVLFIASTVTALAGGVISHHLMYVGLSAFSTDYSIMPIASVVIGGAGSFAGAVLGASLLTILSEFLRALGPVRIAIYGIVMVIFVLAIREGIFPFIVRRYQQFERKVEIN